MITLDDIREYAARLPEVEEKPHFRLPGFRVRDRLFVHLEKEQTHAILCVGQEEASHAAQDDPDTYSEVWRNDGEIFVGLRVDLARVSRERARELVENVGRNKAPKRLARTYEQGA